MAAACAGRASAGGSTERWPTKRERPPRARTTRAAALGTPDIAAAGFRLWVHAWQFPDDRGPHGDWLLATAHCVAHDAGAWVTGPITSAGAVESFFAELVLLERGDQPEAILESSKGGLRVRVAPIGRRGYHLMRVEVEPHDAAHGHWFEAELEHPALDRLIDEVGDLLLAYPLEAVRRETPAEDEDA